MTTPNPEPATVAMTQFTERTRAFVEQAAVDFEANSDRDTQFWADVIIKEAAFLAEEGPAAYSRYVAQLDAAAVRRELDSELTLILGGGQ